MPQLHRTDRLTAAVQPGVEGPKAFKQRYQALLRHYGLQGQAIQAGKGNENGDVEQSHHRFKQAVDQALMLRGSRDFPSRDAYAAFLRQVFRQQNAGRAARLAEELRLAAAVAGASAGGVQAAEGAGGHGQHHARGGERLLGAQPADRRVGRGPAVRRAGRGLVRPEAGGGTAPSARTGQAPHRLPPRHRLAGPQAGGLRRLPLPGGPVPFQPLPHGLRPARGAAAGAGGEGVPAHPAPGGQGERGGGRGGVGRTARRGRAAGRRGGEREAASARSDPAGDRGNGRTSGSERV